MEESLEVVYVLGRIEVRRLYVHPKPQGRRAVHVPVHVYGLFNLHVDAVTDWVKVKHHRLLLKPKTLVRLINHRVDVLVDRLLYVNFMTGYFCDVPLDICQGIKSLFEFQRRVPALNAISSSTTNYLIHSQVFLF